MALCSCLTKMQLTIISDLKINKLKCLSKFKKIKNAGNFETLGCINLLFKKNIFFKNLANYFFIFLLILSIISIFLYYFIHKKRIKNIIDIKNSKD